MNYKLFKDVVGLLEDFESRRISGEYNDDISGFKLWISNQAAVGKKKLEEPGWEGKENGRSAESVISTLLVHLNRYARSYSKAALHESDFSTQEEFIYLINLKAFGTMTKMELIKKNIQEKPVGMQIIDRLINHGWIKQSESKSDKRSKMITLTKAGTNALEKQMGKIRKATKIVAGDLSYPEKMELIRLLNKLNHFHHPIYCRNVDSSQLLDIVEGEYLNQLQ
jgi:DNA-binding MarR family transcriptional regulator